MSAELAARRTAAGAAVRDFRVRQLETGKEALTPGGHIYWSDRLALELESLLEQLASEAGQACPGRTATSGSSAIR